MKQFLDYDKVREEIIADLSKYEDLTYRIRSAIARYYINQVNRFHKHGFKNDFTIRTGKTKNGLSLAAKQIEIDPKTNKKIISKGRIGYVSKQNQCLYLKYLNLIGYVNKPEFGEEIVFSVNPNWCDNKSDEDVKTIVRDAGLKRKLREENKQEEQKIRSEKKNSYVEYTREIEDESELDKKINNSLQEIIGYTNEKE